MAKAIKKWAALAAGELAIGVDVSDKYSHICVVDDAGDVVEESRIRSTSSAFERWFGGRPRARVAMETGTHSPWMSKLLHGLGHEVVVANARNLRLISENDSKNDRTDAELLARLARVDPSLLSPIEHRSKACQVDLGLIRSRGVLVEARTRLINHVRGTVKAHGFRLPGCSAQAFAKKAGSAVPGELGDALNPVIEQIAGLTKEIVAYDKKIELVARERYPQTELIRQVPGVGPITSLCYVLILGDPTRFKSSRAVGSYLGLRPRQDESGTESPELRITKAGNGDLRALLIQSAQYILGPLAESHGHDSDLRRWGLKLASRGKRNAKKRAIVAVARKLSVLLHRLWITAEVYEPLRNTRRRQVA